jgi:cysteine desulfurase
MSDGIGRVHLDHLSTTPLSERVSAAMLGWTDQLHLDPAAPQQDSATVLQAVEAARSSLATLLGANHPSEIIFTSGVDEAVNHALKGGAWARERKGKCVVIGATEHLNVQRAADWLSHHGFEKRAFGVDSQGVYDHESLKSVLDDEVTVISAHLANHETGVIQDFAAKASDDNSSLIGVIKAHANNALIHADLTAAAGRMEICLGGSGIDLASMSGHAIGGPRGIGILWVRQGVRIDSLIHGGGQEGGRRAGPLSVAAIVGLGAAADQVMECLDDSIDSMDRMCDRLRKHLAGRMMGATFNTPAKGAVSGVINLAFTPIAAEPLLVEIDRYRVALSSSSSCTTSAGEPSHVLTAMGADESMALAALRISLSPSSSQSDIDRLLEALDASLRTMKRALA